MALGKILELLLDFVVLSRLRLFQHFCFQILSNNLYLQRAATGQIGKIYGTYINHFEIPNAQTKPLMIISNQRFVDDSLAESLSRLDR